MMSVNAEGGSSLCSQPGCHASDVVSHFEPAPEATRDLILVEEQFSSMIKAMRAVLMQIPSTNLRSSVHVWHYADIFQTKCKTDGK
jgi:hypothetical protein